MGGFFFISFRRSGLYFLDKVWRLVDFPCTHLDVTSPRDQHVEVFFFQFKKAPFELLRYLGSAFLVSLCV